MAKAVAKESFAHIEVMMKDFLTEAKGIQVIIKPLPNGLKISNTKVQRSDTYGNRKYETGLETIHLYTEHANNRKVFIARLEEQPDKMPPIFTDICLSEYKAKLPAPPA